MEMVLENEYKMFLESREIEDNNSNHKEYLKFRVENNKLSIGCFLLHLQETEQDLVVVDLEDNEVISFGEFDWEYNDSANGGIHIWNEDRELNIEVSNRTIVTDNDLDSIIVDDKWSLEIW